MDDHARYIGRTAKSGELFKRASKVLVGGTTRTSVYFPPYPAFMAKGEGCRMVDVDGNAYIDFINNYTTLIHGHGFAPVVEAVIKDVMDKLTRGAELLQTGAIP